MKKMDSRRLLSGRTALQRLLQRSVPSLLFILPEARGSDEQARHPDGNHCARPAGSTQHRCVLPDCSVIPNANAVSNNDWCTSRRELAEWNWACCAGKAVCGSKHALRASGKLGERYFIESCDMRRRRYRSSSLQHGSSAGCPTRNHTNRSTLTSFCSQSAAGFPRQWTPGYQRFHW